MRIYKTPKILTQIIPDIVWRIPNPNHTVFLTFDDGPIPEVTEWVLDVLKSYSALATFFCVGDNVRKYPELLERIKEESHQIGNHTYHHADGWKHSLLNYIHEVETCSKLVPSKLFRPPYGHLKPDQFKELKKQNYKVVYWDLISYDFDKTLSAQDCLKTLKSKTQSGSVIVFHDSLKSISTLRLVLPHFLEFCLQKGFSFGLIPE